MLTVGEKDGLVAVPAAQRPAVRAAITRGVRRGLARAAATQGTQAAPAAPAATRLTSTDPHVNGRSVADLGAELTRISRVYRRLVDVRRKDCVDYRRDELDWYANRGFWGRAVELANAQPPTDPQRWTHVIGLWEQTARALDTALGTPVTPQSINEVGRLSQEAYRAFDTADQLTSAHLREFSRYLQGFGQSADTISTVSTLVRDISFAAAIAIAAIEVAPVAAAWLGPSAQATTVGTLGRVAIGTGVAGAAIEGAGRGSGVLLAQLAEAVNRLISDSDRAADAFDFGLVGGQAWEGAKSGFVTGLLAPVGGEVEKVLASWLGPRLVTILGPGGANLLGRVLRRALARAVSAGATGSVVGALQEGAKAAAAGGDLNAVLIAMEHGFLAGAAAGAALGAAVGGVEIVAADRLRRTMVAKLTELARRADNQQAVKSFAGLLVQMQANPTAGSNAELLGVVRKVWHALRSPKAIAEVLADVWLEGRLLGVDAARSAARRFGQAAIDMSQRSGADVVVLAEGAQFDALQFFEKVVVKGNRFLDLSALKFPDHGVTTHLIQDLVVDRALKSAGMRAEQFRALLAGAEGNGGVKIGELLWRNLYDSLDDGVVNRPEVLWPVLRDALHGMLR